MKQTGRIIIVASLLAFASSAQALVTNLTMSVTNGSNISFDATHTTHTGLFDLTTAPNNYNTLTDVINSAAASFAFHDISGTYNIDVNLATFDFKNQNSVTANITLNGAVTGNALLDLRADGKLSYTITSTSSSSSNSSGYSSYSSYSSEGGGGEGGSSYSFYLDSATLTANVTRTSSDTVIPRAPDGGSSALLLGSALAALGLVARRRRA